MRSLLKRELNPRAHACIHRLHRYARLVLGFLQDCHANPHAVRQHFSVLLLSDVQMRFNRSEPLYLVELGAGHGKFGFLLLRQLWRMREFWPALLRAPLTAHSETVRGAVCLHLLPRPAKLPPHR
jgi:hypothetical protein